MIEGFKPRRLTSGEKAIARSIFGGQVDLDNVKIKPWGWMNRLMAPSTADGQMFLGDIYIRSGMQSADYSKAPEPQRELYIHELTHVWQYQTRPFSLFVDATKQILRGYHKAYELPEKLIKEVRAHRPISMPFKYLNLEQQADMVAAYHGGKDRQDVQKIGGRMMADAGLFLSSFGACSSFSPEPTPFDARIADKQCRR